MKGKDILKRSLIDPPELTNDFDSLAEVYIWGDYLQKVGISRTNENIINLSHYLTLKLNRNKYKQNWVTLNKLRKDVLLIKQPFL